MPGVLTFDYARKVRYAINRFSNFGVFTADWGNVMQRCSAADTGTVMYETRSLLYKQQLERTKQHSTCRPTAKEKKALGLRHNT